MNSLENFLLGVGAGACVVLLGWLILLLWFDVRSRRQNDARIPDSVLSIHARGDSVEPATEPTPRSPAANWSAGTDTIGPPDARSPLAAPSATVDPQETVRLSRRIVVHLFGLGRRAPDDVGRPEATQRGIGAALGAEQSAVSKVVRRLIAAEVVTAARIHVRGVDRRVNVYSLTRKGELLAHEIRSRGAPAPEPMRSPDHPLWASRRAPAPSEIVLPVTSRPDEPNN